MSTAKTDSRIDVRDKRRRSERETPPEITDRKMRKTKRPEAMAATEESDYKVRVRKRRRNGKREPR